MSLETTHDSPHYYSNSEVQVFKRCRRRWRLEYLERWTRRSRERHGNLALGSAVHAGLEHYYREGVDPAEWVNTHLYDPAVAELDPDSDSFTIAQINKDRRLATIMLAGYTEWAESSGLDGGLVGLEPECFLTAEVDGVTLAGTLDIRAQDWQGSTLIRDFKTRQSFDSQMLSMDEQMLMYMLLDTLNTEAKNYVAEHVLMKKVLQTKAAKPPFYLRVPVYHSAAEVAAFQERLMQTIADMAETAASGRFYPTPGDDCSWKCPFFTVCPMFDNGGHPYEYLEEHFEQSSGSYSRGFWGGQEPPRSDSPQSEAGD